MNRAWILTVNGALLALCCFFVARTLAAGAGGWLAPLPEGGAAVAPTAPSQAPSWQDRQVILSRNLFNASTLETGTPEPAQESYEKTRLPLRLLGTVAARQVVGTASWAAVEETDTRDHTVVKVGSQLKDRAEVVRIDRRRIVLSNGGKLEELSLEEDKGTGGPQASRARPAGRRVANNPRRSPAARRRSVVPTPNVQRLSDNRFAMERSDVNAMAGNPAALFSQARIVPKMGEGGGMTGLQLNAIQPGSLFEKIGIQNGDTITEFNGIALTDPSKSAQIFQQLTTAQSVNVTVEGPDGRPRQLQAEIR